MLRRPCGPDLQHHEIALVADAARLAYGPDPNPAVGPGPGPRAWRARELKPVEQSVC